MTKRIILAVALLASAAPLTSAFAECAPNRFGGFYVGANIGEAALSAHQADSDGYFNDYYVGGNTATGNSVVGGLQLGYSKQMHCTVTGVEADWSFGGLKATTDVTPNSYYGYTGSWKSSIDSFGTLRLREGIVVDSTLLFVTGGLAWAQTKDRITFNYNNNNNDPTEELGFSGTRWGWTTGVGAEFAINDKVSFKTEALYLNFGDEKKTMYSAYNDGNYRFGTAANAVVARVGINIKLGDDRRDEPAPLK